MSTLTLKSIRLPRATTSRGHVRLAPTPLTQPVGKPSPSSIRGRPERKWTPAGTSARTQAAVPALVALLADEAQPWHATP